MIRSAASKFVSFVVRPVGRAVLLNFHAFHAAIRTRRLGTAWWTGAVNTDYDPLDPVTAAQPFDAYRALHRGGRVHYNPKRATWILSRLEDVRSALRDTDQVTSTEGVTRLKFSAPLAVLTDGEEHARLRKQVQPGFSSAGARCRGIRPHGRRRRRGLRGRGLGKRVKRLEPPVALPAP
jgi:hypothetical protein